MVIFDLGKEIFLFISFFIFKISKIYLKVWEHDQVLVERAWMISTLHKDKS
jgi:hypothetical protein